VRLGGRVGHTANHIVAAARDFFVSEFGRFFFTHIWGEPMSSQTDAEFDDIDPEFYELIGRIACDWAALEMKINDCIWALSGSPYVSGACVTSQIYTIDGRIKALVALLRLKGAAELVEKTNIYHAHVLRNALVIRNRVVHDIWFSNDSGAANQLLVTADKRLRFQIITRTKENLRKDHKIVEDSLFDFLSISNEIGSLLHTLPNTRPLALFSRYKRHDPTQTHPKLSQSPGDQPQSSLE
jgi:hypothetical protein